MKDNILNVHWHLINQGAKSGGEMESAQAKNQALKDAGAAVPTSFEAFEAAIKETFDKLVSVHDIEVFHIFNFLSPPKHSPGVDNLLEKSLSYP